MVNRRAVRESGTVDRLGVGLVGGGGRRRRLKSRYRCAALRAGGVGTEPLGDAVEVHRLAAAERCNIGLLGEAYDAVPLGRALPCASCCPGLGLLRHQAGLVLLFSAELSVSGGGGCSSSSSSSSSSAAMPQLLRWPGHGGWMDGGGQLMLLAGTERIFTVGRGSGFGAAPGSTEGRRRK